MHQSLFISFKVACEGVFYAFRDNRNLRIHIGAAVLVILAGIFFKVSRFEMAILGIMIVLVIVSEMVNTSLEEMVNLITREHQKEAKIAKDVAAGMVLVASMGALIIGLAIFTPYILRAF